MSEENDSPQTGGAPKAARERSPTFPFIPLKVAIDRLIAFEEHYKRSSALVDTMGPVWGMKAKSGQVAQTLAALRAFGLLDTVRGSTGAEATISEDARTYLRAQQDSIKREVIKRLAIKPRQIHAYWEKWGSDRPSDPVCLDDLVLKARFTQDGAETFLRVYDATIAFAGLSDSDKVHPKPEGQTPAAGDTDSKDESSPDLPIVKVGQYIQRTSQGQEQFRVPARVTWVSEDGSHLRVHGSMTGIPAMEVTIAEPPAAPRPSVQQSSASSENDLNVLLTGQRLQITADVDLAGLLRLKDVLGKYEDILRLLAPQGQRSDTQN